MQKKRRALSEASPDALRRKASSEFTDVKLVRPKKGPTSVSLAEIRRAIKDSYDAPKSR